MAIQLILGDSATCNVRVERDHEIDGMYYIKNENSEYLSAYNNGKHIYWTNTDSHVGSWQQFTIDGEEHVLKSFHDTHLVYEEKREVMWQIEVDESIQASELVRLSNFDASAIETRKEAEEEEDVEETVEIEDSEEETGVEQSQEEEKVEEETEKVEVEEVEQSEAEVEEVEQSEAKVEVEELEEEEEIVVKVPVIKKKAPKAPKKKKIVEEEEAEKEEEVATVKAPKAPKGPKKKKVVSEQEEVVTVKAPKKAPKKTKTTEAESSEEPTVVKTKRIPSPRMKAVTLFNKSQLPLVKAANPENTYAENKKIIGNLWKELDDTKKESWIAEANE